VPHAGILAPIRNTFDCQSGKCADLCGVALHLVLFNYLVLIVLKLLLMAMAGLFRFVRSARAGQQLTQLAAAALVEGVNPSALQAVWKRSLILLALEVATALPLVWLGLALARA